jgi:hypothetical protein
MNKEKTSRKIALSVIKKATFQESVLKLATRIKIKDLIGLKIALSVRKMVILHANAQKMFKTMRKGHSDVSKTNNKDPISKEEKETFAERIISRKHFNQLKFSLVEDKTMSTKNQPLKKSIST